MKGLLLVVFVNFIGIGALIPVLPYAVIDVAGGSETVMALLMASFAFAMFIGAPILGNLSDYFGRRRVLLVSILVSALPMLVLPSAMRWCRCLSCGLSPALPRQYQRYSGDYF